MIVENSLLTNLFTFDYFKYKYKYNKRFATTLEIDIGFSHVKRHTNNVFIRVCIH